MKRSLPLVALIAAATVLLTTGAAEAQTSTNLAGVVTNLKSNLAGVVDVVAIVGFVGGIVLAIAGLFGIKQHSENPQHVKLGSQMAKLIVGMCLVALPYVMGIGVTSMFGGTTGTLKSDGTANQLRSIK